MLELMTPGYGDTRGYVYAGHVLAYIDIVAGVAAKRHAGLQCVRTHVNWIPLPIHWLISFIGHSNVDAVAFLFQYESVTS